MVPKEPVAIVTELVTNAVVAIWVVFVPFAAVVDKGTPVNVGDADKTTLPVPVEALTPVPPFTTGRIPNTFIEALIPAFEPVPPEAIGNAVPRVNEVR
jgi:hypothetical protein